jgi:hypothetical protein
MPEDRARIMSRATSGDVALVDAGALVVRTGGSEVAGLPGAGVSDFAGRHGRSCDGLDREA